MRENIGHDSTFLGSPSQGVTAMAAQGKDNASTAAQPPAGAAPAPRRWLCRLLTLRRREEGVSAVEFALAAPLLLTLTLGIVDLGLALSAQIRVQQAAQAGAQYAQLHGFDATKISTAVTSATSLSVSANPVPSQICGCVSGTSVTLSGSSPCTNTCSNGLTAGTYVRVYSRYTYTPPVPYVSVLSSPTTLTGQALVRVQ